MKTANDGRIGVGFIGYGRATTVIHAPLIEGVEGLAIVAIATSRPEAVAAHRDTPRVHPDAAGLIADPAVDLVVIATPNETHVPLAEAALTGGKHVVVDKPMALCAAEVERLSKLAAQHGRTITAFHNRRWDGDFLAVRKIIAEGVLGEIKLFEAHWDRFRPVAPDSWRNSNAAGAGVLWDLGPHMIDQALSLFGTPDGVHADVYVQRQAARADDYFHLTLRFGGLRCILTASSVIAAARPRFGLHGTKGSFVIAGLDPTENALVAGHLPSDPGFLDRLPAIRGQLTTASGTAELAFPAGDWMGFYRDLRDALRDSRPPTVNPRDIAATIGLIEAAHRG